MATKKKAVKEVKEVKDEVAVVKALKIIPLGIGFQNEDMNLFVAKVNEIIKHINEG